MIPRRPDAIVTSDPGLQPQRTALAWNRTAMAVFVNALLLVRGGAQLGHAMLVVAGCLLLAGSGVMVACGVWRRHQLLNAAQPMAPAPALLLAALAVSGLACACGAWSVWLSMGAVSFG